MNLLWKRGYLAVSAKDLAEAMNIQRSSLYNSFGSREAVFSETLSRYADLTRDLGFLIVTFLGCSVSAPEK